MSGKNILVTGGCGFIGSNCIRYVFGKVREEHRIVNLDQLTYAGNPLNLEDIQRDYPDRYRFVHGDIRDSSLVRSLLEEEQIDWIVHFAAESHVDRSIEGPGDFISTNITGTFILLEAARDFWKDLSGKKFHHISTDEVFGSLGAEGIFNEDTPYDPRSPYSSSKASSDHLVRAYHHTYGLPVTISNCSNNYGPLQFPEKLIPLMILNMQEGKALPVYGDGMNIRDWLYVEDHCSAIQAILEKGRTGETYCIGGDNEWENIRLVKYLCSVVAEQTGGSEKSLLDLITFVKDRPGHDRRYAIDSTKIKKELGWNQSVDFAGGLEKTVAWYLENPEWIESIKTGEYSHWLEKNYEER